MTMRSTYSEKHYNNKSDTERKKVNNVMYGSMKIVLKLDEILKQPEIFLTVKKLTSPVLISYGHEHTITELRKRQNKNIK